MTGQAVPFVNGVPVARFIEHADIPGACVAVQGLVGPGVAVTNVPATKYEGPAAV